MKTFVLDLDNTLIINTPFYHAATADFMAYIFWHKDLNLVAPSTQELYKLIRKIDDERIREIGYTLDRFPESFVETYKYLCRERGIEPVEEEIDIVRNIGNSVFKEGIYEHYGLMPGVKETLEFLLENNATLYTVTKGDLVEQTKKMEANNLFDYIQKENFFVSLTRKTDYFMQIRENNTGIIYSVGDNASYDIDDATEVGLHGIFIGGPGASKTVPEFSNPELVKVYPNFSHIMKTYEEL